MIEPSRPIPPLNRSAVVSLVAAVLTLFSLCIAVAPIPLTGYVCYPAAAVFGLIALVSGIAALVQIRTTREEGRTHALIGVWVGAMALLASACAIGVGILLFPHVVALFPRVAAWVHQYIR
jgi:hypothetical protein